MATSFTVSEIAERVGGTVRGQSNVRIYGVASLEAAGAHEVSWITHPKYAAVLAECNAGAVLAPSDYGETPMVAILCPLVEAAVGKVINMFAPPIPSPPVGVHPSSIVSESARIGDEVAVGPHVVIEDGVVVGDRTILHGGVHLGCGVRVGSDCRIWDHVVIGHECVLLDRVVLHPSVVIGGDGYGYFQDGGRHHKIHHSGTVRIEADVEIGAGSCVDRAKFGVTVVGEGTKIDNLVQVGHNAIIGKHCLLVAHSSMAGSSRLENSTVIAAYSGVREHCVVGEGSVVLVHTGVASDVPAGQVVSGSPAQVHSRRLRGLAATDRLPNWIRRVKELEKRIKRLECPTNDS